MTSRSVPLFALLLCLAALFLPRNAPAQVIPPFVAYHEASDAQHQANWVNLRSQGYRIISLSVFGDPANERYAAVWVKRAGPLQAAIHNTNAAGYQSFFNTVTADGYRPIIVTATGPPATATFAAVFEKSAVPGWFAAHDLVSGLDTATNTIEYKHRWARLNGYIPISVSRYGTTSSDTRYAGVWVYNPTDVAWNYTTGPFAIDYQQNFDAFTAMFYRPSIIGVNNGQRYSAVFRDDRIGPYYAYHDLTSQAYQDAFNLRTSQGYYPILVEGSGIGTGARFAAIFAKQETPIARAWKVTGATPTGISATDTAKFDSIMKLHMQRHGVRAGQFSFSKDGKMIYSRAFTWAEPGYPTTQTYSPMRLASNSKAFACAAITKLKESHPTLLSQKVFPLLGITSKALASQTVDSRINDITVQHLVSHEGGWDLDISNFDAVFKCREISWKLGETDGPLSAWNMARFMYGEPLQFTPGSRDRYSNIGYVLMGLVVEKLSGKTFEDYVQENVLAPKGLSGVWMARSAKENRLANEGYYDDPSVGLTSLIPYQYALVPGVYGGHGFLTEPMHGGGGMAATATSMTQFIYNYAVWGLGGRNANAARAGSMPGTSSLAVSRGDGADYAFILNTRHWKAGYADPVAALNEDLAEALNGIKPRVESVTTLPATPAGGQQCLGRVILSFKAPAGGVVVTLNSSNTAAATVPASVTVSENLTSAYFPITTYPQTSNASTLLKATYNGTYKTKLLTVTPIQLATLTLTPGTVNGGTNVTGKITVYGTAAADTTVTVSSSSSAADIVGPVVIQAGASSTTFTITTDAVTSDTIGLISASLSGVSKSAKLLIKAPVLSSLKLTPNPVAGGDAVTGQVAMTGPVAVNTVVQLSNANTKALLPSGSATDTVTVLAGSKTATFFMKTAKTAVNVSGTVKATHGAISKSVTLTVTP
jgi:CubicO group peptidase (beta-lactamase class C family)